MFPKAYYCKVERGPDSTLAGFSAQITLVMKGSGIQCLRPGWSIIQPTGTDTKCLVYPGALDLWPRHTVYLLPDLMSWVSIPPVYLYVCSVESHPDASRNIDQRSGTKHLKNTLSLPQFGFT